MWQELNDLHQDLNASTDSVKTGGIAYNTYNLALQSVKAADSSSKLGADAVPSAMEASYQLDESAVSVEPELTERFDKIRSLLYEGDAGADPEAAAAAAQDEKVSDTPPPRRAGEGRALAAAAGKLGAVAAAMASQADRAGQWGLAPVT